MNNALDINSLCKNDIVIHVRHGYGKFLDIVTLDVEGSKQDFIKILYANHSILYLPIEEIALIKRYGNFDIKLDKLGAQDWSVKKIKIHKKIYEIANRIVNLSAARNLIRVSPNKIDKKLYDDFCKDFPYEETPDQQKTINDIIHDLTEGKLMDRLICGDVGFGKTEIILRAVFLVLYDLSNYNIKQVLIVVPTTILCKQHYNTCINRLEKFDINIAYVSRSTSDQELLKIQEQLVTGQIQILIATHRILFSKLKFQNLKLVVIDEEQHFGAEQKEKIKSIQKDAHILYVSATPIPRTMYSALSGIKDISIMVTPPLNRKAVITKVENYDLFAIKKILLSEKNRGGQSIFVCPKIYQIHEVERFFDKHIKELKYKVLHGAMDSDEIDLISTEFYQAKYDVLISTTIVQSGIDIPNVNTMIVIHPENLGLSQLYQLRGRVGRSNTQSYFYVFARALEQITGQVQERLNIIQSMQSLGQCFLLSSYDMEMRGYGDLLGAKQSGYVKSIGIELYQDILNKAIYDIQNNNNIDFTDIESTEIKLHIRIFISDEYIQDNELKIAICKKISAIQDQSEIKELNKYLRETFGEVPLSIQNFMLLSLIRNIAYRINITTIMKDNNYIIFIFKESYMCHFLHLPVIISKCKTREWFLENNRLFIKHIGLSDRLLLESIEQILYSIRKDYLSLK